MPRTRLLAESWTAIAQQYEHRLAPLFQPWLDELVGSLDARDLPEGDVIVPACGPGIELLMLAEVLPGESRIVGIDLAAGMVDVANTRIAATPDRLLRYEIVSLTVTNHIAKSCCLAACPSMLPEQLFQDLCVMQTGSSNLLLPCRQRVSACVGDACNLAILGRPPALILSCFGLQQMPEPSEVSTLDPHALSSSSCLTDKILDRLYSRSIMNGQK